MNDLEHKHGSLDQGGYLFITRKNGKQEIGCCNMQVGCGGWCGHFGEPTEQVINHPVAGGISQKPTGKTILGTCRSNLIFETFEDLRDVGKE